MIRRHISLIPLVHQPVSLLNVAGETLRIKQGRRKPIPLQLTANLSKLFRIGGKFDRKSLILFLC